MKRINQAKSLVTKRQFRSQVVKDRTKYSRKAKHKKAPVSGAFCCAGHGSSRGVAIPGLVMPEHAEQPQYH